MAELLDLTLAEWMLVGAGTLICVLGLLLPKAGNLLGLIFMGQDPEVVRWRAALAERRRLMRALRQTRKAEKRARKQMRRERSRRRQIEDGALSGPELAPRKGERPSSP